MKKSFCLVLVIIVIASCEPLDLKRVKDTTTDDIEITGTSVIAHGTILDVGNVTIIEHGHCWSKSPGPSADDTINSEMTKLGNKTETGEYSSRLFGLIPGTEYYLKSYIYDGASYTYGEELSFEITAEHVQFNSFNIEKLDEVGSILVTSSANGVGSINFNEHGHCWSKTNPPTINDSEVTALGNIESDTSFISQIDDLTMGVYYIRGYLEAEGVVVYTNTLVYESTISVETGSVNVNPNNTAVAEGEVKSLGVNPIVDHGHCWSTTTSNPNINNRYNSLGSMDNLGVFNSNLNDFITGRTYYIRAYAFDGSKYYYGSIKSFIVN